MAELGYLSPVQPAQSAAGDQAAVIAPDGGRVLSEIIAPVAHLPGVHAACFIKICSYFPYPVKVWLNGHEWAKRQAARAGIGFTELSNGFASCPDPAALRAICDRLGSQQVQAWFGRWLSRLPLPTRRGAGRPAVRSVRDRRGRWNVVPAGHTRSRHIRSG